MYPSSYHNVSKLNIFIYNPYSYQNLEAGSRPALVLHPDSKESWTQISIIINAIRRRKKCELEFHLKRCILYVGCSIFFYINCTQNKIFVLFLFHLEMLSLVWMGQREKNIMVLIQMVKFCSPMKEKTLFEKRHDLLLLSIESNASTS